MDSLFLAYTVSYYILRIHVILLQIVDIFPSSLWIGILFDLKFPDPDETFRLSSNTSCPAPVYPFVCFFFFYIFDFSGITQLGKFFQDEII